jgi:NADH:ubiquinone oxidoreductase subunit D
MDRLFFGNTITRGRTKGVGVLSAEDAIAWGASGPVARASGVNWDLRKHDTYSVYPRFDFDVPTGSNGDCYDRGRVRLYEAYESCRIIEQASPRWNPGPYAPRACRASSRRVPVMPTITSNPRAGPSACISSPTVRRGRIA